MTINNISKMLVLASFLAGGAMVAKPTYAQYYSQGEQKLSIVVDKSISDVVNPEYFDNIASSKKIFREKDLIDFKIVVQNSGNTNLSNIKVVDYLPKYLQVINAYNSVSDNTISLTVDNLNVGETKTYNIRASIANTPIETYINQKWQMTNRVCVSTDKISDCDNASYFVGGKVMPTTGNETLILQSVLVLGASISVLGVKRLIRGY